MKLLYLHYPFYLFTLYNHILHLHLTFILSLYFAFQISVVHLRLIYFLRLISTFYICVLRKYISDLPLAFMFFGLVLSPHLYLCFRSFRNSANSRALPCALPSRIAFPRTSLSPRERRRALASFFVEPRTRLPGPGFEASLESLFSTSKWGKEKKKRIPKTREKHDSPLCPLFPLYFSGGESLNTRLH